MPCYYIAYLIHCWLLISYSQMDDSRNCMWVTCYKHLLMNSAILRSDKSLWIVLISLVPSPHMPSDVVRAGSNGTASTTMAIPVFEEKKWCRLDSKSRVRYGIASYSGLSQQGLLWTFPSLQASKVVIRRLRVSQFSMAIFECKSKLERGYHACVRWSFQPVWFKWLHWLQKLQVGRF